MRDQKRRGNVILEFALVTAFFLLPMFLFTYAIGFNLLMQLEVVQFTRDAGHLFVTTQQSFASTDFMLILDKVGASTGYPSAAQVYFYRVMYVDAAQCAAGAPSTCSNSGQWVIAQFFKDPNGTKPPGFTPTFGDPTGVGTPDAQGNYSAQDYVKLGGLNINAAFSRLGILPYAANPTLGLPTGQTIYLVQVAALPFNVPGITSFTALGDYAAF